jgi:hypothetical protein
MLSPRTFVLLGACAAASQAAVLYRQVVEDVNVLAQPTSLQAAAGFAASTGQPSLTAAPSAPTDVIDMPLEPSLLAASSSGLSSPATTGLSQSGSECIACYSTELPYGTFRADFKFTDTATQTIIPYITEYDDGSPASTSYETIAPNGSTISATSSASAAATTTSATLLFGEEANMLDGLKHAELSVSNGKSFEFRGYTL